MRGRKITARTDRDWEARRPTADAASEASGRAVTNAVRSTKRLVLLSENQTFREKLGR